MLVSHRWPWSLPNSSCRATTHGHSGRILWGLIGIKKCNALLIVNSKSKAYFFHSSKVQQGSFTFWSSLLAHCHVSSNSHTYITAGPMQSHGSLLFFEWCTQCPQRNADFLNQYKYYIIHVSFAQTSGRHILWLVKDLKRIFLKNQ